jgi:uroporphyrinogen-III synthase
LSAASLLGRRVAVTRAAEQAGTLAERLSALGAEVLVCPLIAIAPPADCAPLRRALARLDAYDWLVLPSANAARALLGRVDGAPRWPRVAAVGTATAAVLVRRGVVADLVPEEHSAAGVLAVIGELRGARVLLPQSDLAGPALADGLLARGARVDVVPAYRTLAGPGVGRLAAVLREGGLDAVTFASPSAVRALLDGLRDAGLGGVEIDRMLAGVALVAIGPTTAAAMGDAGLVVAAVAEPHSDDGMAAALLALLSRG